MTRDVFIVLGILAILAALDFVRLVIKKVIWNRRHRRMVAELKRKQQQQEVIMHHA